MAPKKFGTIRQTGEGKWSARYQYAGRKHSSPHPFVKESHAAAWLEKERGLIRDGDWTPPADRTTAKKVAALTVSELVDLWLASPHLKPSTTQSHRRKLQTRVLRESFDGFDSLADLPVMEVDRKRIQLWWTQVLTNWPDQKSTNAAAYKRLHTAFEHALHELEIITENPVKVKGAGKAPRPENRDRPLISVPEAQRLVTHSPARLKIGTMLLLWSGLRLGELLELRRKDLLGLKGDGAVTLRVRRNTQRITDPTTKKQTMITLETPKTEAGNRDIILPQSVAEALREHAKEFMETASDALVITTSTGAQMMDTNFRNRFNRAAELAGRPDITPHDCRRFYGTHLVSPDHESGRGAPVSLEEARRLMGHETVEQLMEYQRAAEGYETRAADALNDLIENEGGRR